MCYHDSLTHPFPLGPSAPPATTATLPFHNGAHPGILTPSTKKATRLFPGVEFRKGAPTRALPFDDPSPFSSSLSSTQPAACRRRHRRKARRHRRRYIQPAASPADAAAARTRLASPDGAPPPPIARTPLRRTRADAARDTPQVPAAATSTTPIWDGRRRRTAMLASHPMASACPPPRHSANSRSAASPPPPASTTSPPPPPTDVPVHTSIEAAATDARGTARTPLRESQKHAAGADRPPPHPTLRQDLGRPSPSHSNAAHLHRRRWPALAIPPPPPTTQPAWPHQPWGCACFPQPRHHLPLPRAGYCDVMAAATPTTPTSSSRPAPALHAAAASRTSPTPPLPVAEPLSASTATAYFDRGFPRGHCHSCNSNSSTNKILESPQFPSI